MSNRFYTILVVPEKTQKVKKVVVPSLVVKSGVALTAFLSVLGLIMILDYANVMSQITENKKLKVENRELRERVQIFKDKIITIDNTLDRVKTFATKLRIITNIEESPVNSTPAATPSPIPSPPILPTREADHTSTNSIDADTDTEFTENSSAPEVKMGVVSDPEADKSKRKNLIASLMTDAAISPLTLSDADSSLFVKAEFEKLDQAYGEINHFASETETEVQFILDKLSEKRAQIAGTPTKLPTLGYITSEYGVRINPYEGRRKMHEGIDIANRFGADVIAPANGLVSFAGNKSGYGKVVIVDHGNGLETYYAHLSRYTVRDGMRVKRGQLVGSVGNSGHSTGPHLHYEVRANGLPVDPCWYILDSSTVCRSR